MKNTALRPLLLLGCLFLTLTLSVVSVSATSPTADRTVTIDAPLPTEALSTPLAVAFYEDLSLWVEKLASGEANTAVYELPMEKLSSLGLVTEWTAESLGVTVIDPNEVNEAFWEQLQFSRVLDLLRLTHPFSLYWYDKTESGGASYGISASADNPHAPTRIRVSGASVLFSVSLDYRADGYDPRAPRLDPDGIEKATAARATADAIVQAHAQKSPTEQLAAFRDVILDAVSYNTTAASGGVSYGDSWQPVSVFDGDASTNVVCEGYAKAFAYLCDAAGLNVYTVTGVMNGENHMWNLVKASDGRIYLADLTNADGNEIEDFFLVGATGSPESAYRLQLDGTTVTYRYDAETLSLYGTDALTLSDQDFDGVYGVGFGITGNSWSIPYDARPVKAFLYADVQSNSPEWQEYNKAGVFYLGDEGIADEDLTHKWFYATEEGTYGAPVLGEPIDAGSYLLAITRRSDNTTFLSPVLTITPCEVFVESITAQGRDYDGTNGITALSATLSASIPLSEHLSLDLDALSLTLPRADVGIYSTVNVGGTLRFAEEDPNFVLLSASTLPLLSPLRIEKASAPTLDPITVPLDGTAFFFDAGTWATEALPDAGDLMIGVERARKWGTLTVLDWRMDENACIQATFVGLFGGDRLEFELLLTSQNYEDVTVRLVASAPCPYDGHLFEDYRSDGNATCTADGTKTASCAGCDVTDTVTDEGSRTAHTYEDGACIRCNSPAPTDPTEQETQTEPSVEESLTESTPTPSPDGDATDEDDPDGDATNEDATQADPEQATDKEDASVPPPPADGESGISTMLLVVTASVSLVLVFLLALSFLILKKRS